MKTFPSNHGCAGVCLLLALLAPPLLQATPAPPEWWTQGSIPPINQNPSAPLAVATVGQAKWMAKCALDALQSKNPALASQISADLVGTGKPIATWSVPVACTPEADAMYAPLQVGQLKAIADPFYRQLNATVPAWLADQRQMNLTQDPADSTFIFPWTAQSTDDSNKAFASVGQLKAAFALRFETLGIDADGLSDEQEQALGTSPVLADTDGDGINDNLDAFPLDASRWLPMTPTSGDVTAPVVTLMEPATAVYVSGP